MCSPGAGLRRRRFSFRKEGKTGCLSTTGKTPPRVYTPQGRPAVNAGTPSMWTPRSLENGISIAQAAARLKAYHWVRFPSQKRITGRIALKWQSTRRVDNDVGAVGGCGFESRCVRWEVRQRCLASLPVLGSRDSFVADSSLKDEIRNSEQNRTA